MITCIPFCEHFSVFTFYGVEFGQQNLIQKIICVMETKYVSIADVILFYMIYRNKAIIIRCPFY